MITTLFKKSLPATLLKKGLTENSSNNNVVGVITSFLMKGLTENPDHLSLRSLSTNCKMNVIFLFLYLHYL
ncbi:hypothetical protein MSKOL_1768 [Methanosarcina sp. Kolksee]|nr:hypothetical protein MSKOL_1768 [Methanosarcina sp. Kolksee]